MLNENKRKPLLTKSANPTNETPDPMSESEPKVMIGSPAGVLAFTFTLNQVTHAAVAAFLCMALASSLHLLFALCFLMLLACPLCLLPVCLMLSLFQLAVHLSLPSHHIG